MSKVYLYEGGLKIIEMLPEEEQASLLKKRAQSKKRLENDRIPNWDSQIQPNLWYAGSFGPNDEFLFIPHGWFNIHLAKIWWTIKLKQSYKGKVFFHRGKDIIYNKWALTNIMYLDSTHRKGRPLTVKIISRIIIPKSVDQSGNYRSYFTMLKKHSGITTRFTKESENLFFTTLFNILNKEAIEDKHLYKTVKLLLYKENKLKQQWKYGTKSSKARKPKKRICNQ